MPAATSLMRKLRPSLRSLTDTSAGIVVGVSGGADSIALLRAIVEARDEQTPYPLVIAHFNHQLRGQESDADEEFVAALHARLVSSGRPRLMLCRTRFDVAALAKAERTNLEALARRERYRWLAKVARDHGMKHVATGHTANDQAETVLHRLLRGTGVRGLRGIASQRELEPGITLVRPLLAATRSEIIHYLTELAQTFREDATNKDVDYTRNRLRHELLPLLAQQYNPAIVRVLTSLAEQAEEAFQIEDAAARALLAETELPRAGELLIFDHRRLRMVQRNQVRAMFRLVWQREKWPNGRMNFAAWERLASIVFDDSAAIDLPGNLHARRLGFVMQVGRRPL